jgi:hypothetical protein
VIRRGAANRAVKAAAEFRRDNLKTNGSEIDTDILIAIVVCLTIRLRKFGATRPAAFRASESFGPLIASSHPANMRRKRTGSSQYPCHKQTDPRRAGSVIVGTRGEPACDDVSPRWGIASLKIQRIRSTETACRLLCPNASARRAHPTNDQLGRHSTCKCSNP